MREKVLVVIENGEIVQVKSTADIKILIANVDSVSHSSAKQKFKAKIDSDRASKAFPIECELYDYK